MSGGFMFNGQSNGQYRGSSMGVFPQNPKLIVQPSQAFTQRGWIPMIAAAMDTPDSPRLAYVELARRAAVIECAIAADELPRLAALCKLDGEVRVQLQFAWDNNYPRVCGVGEALVFLACQRCFAPVATALRAEFDLALGNEAFAVTQANVTDVRTVAGETITPAEILEDELLLALPSQPCTRLDCDQVPAMRYGPNGDNTAQAQESHANERDNPFAVLEQLKQTRNKQD